VYGGTGIDGRGKGIQPARDEGYSVLVAQGLRMLGLVLYRLSKFPSSVETHTTREVGASAAPAEEHAGEVCVV
jgi:hypothetical protein